MKNLFLALTLTVSSLVLSSRALAHEVPCPLCGLKVVQATKAQDNEVVLRFGKKRIEYRCVYCALADAKKLRRRPVRLRALRNEGQARDPRPARRASGASSRSDGDRTRPRGRRRLSERLRVSQGVRRPLAGLSHESGLRQGRAERREAAHARRDGREGGGEVRGIPSGSLPFADGSCREKGPPKEAAQKPFHRSPLASPPKWKGLGMESETCFSLPPTPPLTGVKGGESRRPSQGNPLSEPPRRARPPSCPRRRPELHPLRDAHPRRRTGATVTMGGKAVSGAVYALRPRPRRPVARRGEGPPGRPKTPCEAAPPHVPTTKATGPRTCPAPCS